MTCKKSWFLSGADTLNCLSSHFLSLFTVKSSLEVVACSFLRNGFRATKEIVCVSFLWVCRCAWARKDRTSYFFSLPQTLSVAWRIEMLEVVYWNWRCLCSEHWINFQWQEVACVSTKQAHRGLSEYITWNVIRGCMYWISAFCCHWILNRADLLLTFVTRVITLLACMWDADKGCLRHGAVLFHFTLWMLLLPQKGK